MEKVKHPERVEGCGLPETAHFNTFSVLGVYKKLALWELARSPPYLGVWNNLEKQREGSKTRKDEYQITKHNIISVGHS